MKHKTARSRTRTHREYFRCYNQRLHRNMGLLVFGHTGVKVLGVPTRDGSFHEHEDQRAI